ncbi:MAG TPA: flagellar biosynthesis protein FlhB [Dongiaceae bacterium]|jgi:flagellar biosynthetic protein FlhB|nr:flagellar biosynthesis protein FlhB [Dongiaceae bacterium]
MSDTDDSQKTEDPTGRRLQEAHDSGNVANSREVNNLFMILALTISVVAFAGAISRDLVNLTLPFVESPDKIPTDLGHLTTLGWKLMGMILLSGAAPLALAVIAAFGSGYLQFGLILSGDSLMPDLEKISPLAGLKRIFSLRSLSEFLKGLLKISIVGGISFWILMPSVGDLHKLIGMEMVQLLAVIRQLIDHLLIAVLCAMVAITLADILYQRYEHIKQLRMSRQELKDEMRESEGDPLIKSRLRQLRMERARKRMMAEVPKADVVVTNPTHYAVALRYEQAEMAAPKVIAKGVDAVAQKIREIAAEHNIPVVENPPLARGLYASVEIDQEVPPEFYKAVAEVIGYIYKLKRRRL